jgi:hypothetical protein
VLEPKVQAPVDAKKKGFAEIRIYSMDSGFYRF